MNRDMAGKITISRPRGGGGPGCVRIYVEDAVSGCGVFEAEMDLTAFAETVFALGCQPLTYTVNESLAGMKRELRDIVVPRPPYTSRQDDAQRKAALKWITKHAKHELVNGWEPHHPTEIYNSHRWVEGDRVRLGLIRFVEVPSA